MDCRDIKQGTQDAMLLASASRFARLCGQCLLEGAREHRPCFREARRAGVKARRCLCRRRRHSHVGDMLCWMFRKTHVAISTAVLAGRAGRLRCPVLAASTLSLGAKQAGAGLLAILIALPMPLLAAIPAL